MKYQINAVAVEDSQSLAIAVLARGISYIEVTSVENLLSCSLVSLACEHIGIGQEVKFLFRGVSHFSPHEQWGRGEGALSDESTFLR